MTEDMQAHGDFLSIMDCIGHLSLVLVDIHLDYAHYPVSSPDNARNVSDAEIKMARFIIPTRTER